MVYVLARFLEMLGTTGAGEGAVIGLWVWLGFIATVSLGSVLWEGKPLKLYYINVAYYALDLAIIGAILASWV